MKKEEILSRPQQASAKNIKTNYTITSKYLKFEENKVFVARDPPQQPTFL